MSKTFPDDPEFQEHVLTKVEADEGGWHIFHDAVGFWCPDTLTIEPRPGMTARFYGKGLGLGHCVRGLYINGRKAFYRTEAEDNDKFEIDLYGKDAADWLARWDAGKIVWTIEMGGLGPSYEQCIHITCAEILREMLNGGYDTTKWYDEADKATAQWKRDRERIDEKVTPLPIINQLGLSGAQWYAALNIASFLYRRGPRWIMNDPAVKDRHIQVRKSFP